MSIIEQLKIYQAVSIFFLGIGLIGIVMYFFPKPKTLQARIQRYIGQFLGIIGLAGVCGMWALAIGLTTR